MATPRRVGAENSAVRTAIIDAAEKVILEDGYAAASTRRVAARAGLKPSLIHYYFPTTDDLLLAVSRRGAAASDAELEEALRAKNPLRALWRHFTDSSRTALALEFMALANHRKSIRAEIAEHSEKMRERQVEVFTQLLGDRLSGPGGCPPAGLSVVLAGIGRALVMENGFGIAAGHEEARAFVEAWLDRLAPDQADEPER
jgi:AcrR family transcriptional regulator